MTAKDPREIIDRSAMTTAQFFVVILTVLLNAMDGFDILSISFASPGIAKEWGVAPAALGVVLSMELIGMGIGSVFLGGLADKIGRRPTLLACLVVMIGGMLGATTSTGPVVLSAWRLITGLGIGGMLACTNAVVAEFSNSRWRSLCISFMVIGYPLGGGFGGLYASALIAKYDWRSVFYLGAIATAILLPLTALLIPESVPWLARKQPENALAKINHSLSKLKLETVPALPAVPPNEKKKSLSDIFSPALLAITVTVTLAYFLHILSFYFLLKWSPKIIADMGFAPSSTGRVLSLANFGGAAGGALFGLLISRIGLKRLTIITMVVNAFAIAAFGRSPHDLTILTWLAVIAGFFGNAAISGMYSIVAHAFPTHVRATGTGFVVGMGRSGAVLSPMLAGLLLQEKVELPTIALVMCAGSMLAAIVLSFLNLNPEKPVAAQETKSAAGLAPSRA
ncbi:MAG: MFS transporter [Acidobacteriota bacterium]